MTREAAFKAVQTSEYPWGPGDRSRRAKQAARTNRHGKHRMSENPFTREKVCPPDEHRRAKLFDEWRDANPGRIDADNPHAHPFYLGKTIS
jgi:hypothetical protein